MTYERIVHCPKCGSVLIRNGLYIEHYKGLGIMAYDTHCEVCDITIGIEDMSNYEQEGKITITFA